ncbi:MAG: hypothetical protein ACI4PM_04400 [Butyricicoccus sp.]
MQNKKYYRELKEFLVVSRLTVPQFAERANIDPEILKEMFHTESKLIIGNFISIAMGCRKVMEEQSDASTKAELQTLYTRYFEEYLLAWPNDFLSIPNPHFIRRIEQMAELAGETVHTKVQRLLHPERTEPEKPKQPARELPISEESGDFRTKLNALLDRLNENGQREVLKRVEELTYVPAYKK